MATDLRSMVREELERIGKSWYWLGRQPGVTCHEDSVRSWLHRGTNLGALHVEEILRTLGFKVKPPRGAARELQEVA